MHGTGASYTANTQVVGFTDSDNYQDALHKAAMGLGLKCQLHELQLLCSGGIVTDNPILGDVYIWILGGYIVEEGPRTAAKKYGL